MISDNVTRLVPLHELPKESRLVVNCAAEIKPEKIDWLWEQRLPLGKCVLVAGEGGLGKSMVLAWIAATVSRGKEWPCCEGQSRRGSVVILSAEDDAADTIVPRLLAADADCSKVHILEAVRKEDDEGQRSFNLQLDLPELEKTIEKLGDVLLIIIDPITSYLGKVDSHKNAELRSVLEPLGKMAARLHVTIIANTHLSKASGGSANSRVIGSVAFVNHARAAFIVSADPEDSGRRLFLPSKSNLGKPRDGLAYRIADTIIPGSEGSVIWAPYVKWEDATVNMSADEAVSAAAAGVEGKTAKAEAINFLLAELADGPKPVNEVNKAATAAGHTPKAIRTAREALGIKPQKAGMHEGWLWGLPKMPNHPEDAHSREWAPSAQRASSVFSSSPIKTMLSWLLRSGLPVSNTMAVSPERRPRRKPQRSFPSCPHSSIGGTGNDDAAAYGKATGSSQSVCRYYPRATRREGWPALNSIRYMERQPRITTGHSSELVAEALAGEGVIFFNLPTCGVRLKPARGEEFRD